MFCNDKGPTITIMKSKAARVFGGFTQESWNKSGGVFKKDETAFIFSMDRQQIYRPQDTQKAIFCYSSWGPSFGGSALALKGDLLNEEDAG